MGHLEKVLVIKLDDMSLILRTPHGRRREWTPTSCPLMPPNVYYGTCVHIYTHIYTINKYKDYNPNSNLKNKKKIPFLTFRFNYSSMIAILGCQLDHL